jgi:uncharacterized protein (DUF1015 family)
MPRVHPLRIIHPDAQYAAQVSARISGTETQDELTHILEDNPFSYLHVVKPYLHFADPEHQEKHFSFGRNYFRQLQDQHVLIEETNRQMLVYRQSDEANGAIFEGIIAGVSIQDYLNGCVRKHEHTLTQKEIKLVKHMEVTHAVGEPVLLCYESHHDLPDFETLKGKNICDFVCEGNLRHQLWLIPQEAHLFVQEFFSKCSDFYIADGHHRIAATTRYLIDHREELSREEDQTFMSLILRSDQMEIKPFHRLIHCTTLVQQESFLSQLEPYFTYVKEDTFVKPKVEGEFGLCINQQYWYRLTLKESYRPGSHPGCLDVSCLESFVFHALLGIEDSKNDNRLVFSRGDMPEEALSALMKEHNANLTFTLYPNSFRDIKAVADIDGVMPPKSTWIEPKLRTGMVIQLF